MMLNARRNTSQNTPMVELVQAIQAEIDGETVAELRAEIEETKGHDGNR